MRIDVPRLDATIERTRRRVGKLDARLKDHEVWRIWKKRFGDKSKMGSRQQLAEVLFNELGHKSNATTRTGRAKTDLEALDKIDDPFVRNWLKCEKLKKALATNLVGLKREIVDGYLRPMFGLNIAKTYRSSCERPNGQNLPIRDPVLGEMVRTCFIPRDGHVLVELDYGALEFRGAAMWWKDNSMIAYASNPSKDIHRDMAAECFCLPVDSVPKKVRFYAKNQFVFPILYGSYYVNCSKNLWKHMLAESLETVDGVPMKEHLRRHGVDKGLGRCDPRQRPVKGTFEHHIQQVEKAFNEKFPTWSKRKYEWWNKYEARGSFKLMTGFECAGVFSHNDLYNWVIQGPSFHLLLWSLIQMVNWLRKNRMRTVVIGQIHDSMMLDCHRDEMDEVLAKTKAVMIDEVRAHWDWVIVPLLVEAELAETNWYEKKEIEI